MKVVYDGEFYTTVDLSTVEDPDWNAQAIHHLRRPESMTIVRIVDEHGRKHIYKSWKMGSGIITTFELPAYRGPRKKKQSAPGRYRKTQ